LRKFVCDYIQEHKATYFSDLEEGLTRHVQNRRQESTWAIIYELYAASECFNYAIYDSNLEEYCSVKDSRQFTIIYLGV